MNLDQMIEAIDGLIGQLNDVSWMAARNFFDHTDDWDSSKVWEDDFPQIMLNTRSGVQELIKKLEAEKQYLLITGKAVEEE